MEEPTSSPQADRNRIEELARLLKEQRGSCERFFAAQRERLARAKTELTEAARRRHEQLGSRVEELEGRRSRVETDEAELQRQRQALSLAQEQHRAEVAQLEDQRRRIDQKQVELQAEREDLDARRLHTDGQRRRIARELRAQQAALARDLDRRAAELEQQTADLDRRASELDRRATETPAVTGSADDDGPGEDYKRLYEMALEDIRDMKSRVEEQEKKLAGACASGAAAAVDLGGGLDWEAQKRRILAALESDLEPGDEQAAEERLKMEQVVRTTEEAMAVKDREIIQLRQQLEEHAAALPGDDSPSAAPILENDKAIQEEHRQLAHLKEQMQEKLRKAEIDISIERAKIARERAEIEEKLRALHKARDGEESESANPDEREKPPRGRWLAHLGITDIED